jgi:Zn finger protein HypA/HybF involved in hydrogenase expression
MAEAYCLRCRASREVSNPREVKLKNGRPAVEGTCPVCKTKLFRIVKG